MSQSHKKPVSILRIPPDNPCECCGRFGYEYLLSFAWENDHQELIARYSGEGISASDLAQMTAVDRFGVFLYLLNKYKKTSGGDR
jgi:hypothetical protein